MYIFHLWYKLYITNINSYYCYRKYEYSAYYVSGSAYKIGF